MKKSFIEQDFPIKRVSKESARDKLLRHGHLSTLHVWWARRPLAASRATIYSSFIPVPPQKSEYNNKLKFIAELCTWENSENRPIIERARREIIESNNNEIPKVLDPFAGGGSIPLEALRLGCDTYASDLNPVAFFLERAVLEYPQKYGSLISKKEYLCKRPWINDEVAQLCLMDSMVSPLIEDVRYWSNWVFKEAQKEVGYLYPGTTDGFTVIAFLWAWTIICQNPSCKATIPLLRQTWLSKKKNKKIALKILTEDSNIKFKIVENDEIDFDPKFGTTARAKVMCPCCKTSHSAVETREQFVNRTAGQRLIAKVLYKPGTVGKVYRIAYDEDMDVFNKVSDLLKNKEKELTHEWNIPAIPDEPIKRVPVSFGVINVWVYGITKWGHMHNLRQQLAIITFIDKVRKAYNRIVDLYNDKDYVKAVISYLAILIDRIADFSSINCQWENSTEAVKHVFTGPKIPMMWDYAESNPFSGSTGSFSIQLTYVLKVLNHCCNIYSRPAQIKQESATSLSYPDEYFDAVFTDPPYYDNIPYSYISDFFYVWLRRSVGHIFKGLFSTPLTPKSEEIVAYSKNNESVSGKKFFEEMISKSFSEISRVLKPDGIAYIVYAHKSTDAWESIINAILNSGLYLVASWPIHTEMKTRLRASESAALASSIYMICRKRLDDKTTFYNEIKPSIEERIHDKLDQFWNEGIGGSDFFISAIGPAVEVFGKYTRVEKLSGEKVSVMELLEFIRKVVSEYALSKILRSPQLGGVDIDTRFYLIWRWTYNSNKIIFDDARKLAQAIGFHFEQNWESGGIIKKDKEWISVKGPFERKNDEVFQRRIAKKYPEILQEALFEAELVSERVLSMIDVLHQCLVFWDMGFKQNISKLLEASDYRNNNDFWRVAQSISDVLPEGDKEKQLLQGFLYGKETYQTGKIPTEPKIEQKSLFGDEK